MPPVRLYMRTGMAAPGLWFQTIPYGPWNISSGKHTREIIQAFMALTLVANVSIASTVFSEEEQMDVD